MATLKIVQTF